jgi:integrase
MQLLDEEDKKKSSVSLQILKDSIYSNYTKKVYVNAIKMYSRYFDIKDYDNLLTFDKNQTVDMIRKFILYLRNERQLSHGRMNVLFAALKLYYEQNDYPFELSWSKLARFKGKNNGKKNQDRTYTREEIQLMLQHSDLRMKCIILVMLSSGVRTGGLAGLRLKDLTYIEQYKLYRIVVYSDSTNDQYYTFTTPECSNYIKLYLEYRKNQGENLVPDSPLIRQKFDTAFDPNDIAVTSEDIQERMRYLLKKVGTIKQNKPVTTGKGNDYIYTEQEKIEIRKKRYEVMRCHGFRKFFNTTCIESDMNIVAKELLMGHKQSLGLEKSYYRPTNDKLLNEYLKVIDDLTINDENRLSKQVQELQEKNQDKDYIIQGKLIEKDDQIKALQESIKFLSDTVNRALLADPSNKIIYHEDENDGKNKVGTVKGIELKPELNNKSIGKIIPSKKK